jgi:hypothetical protein
LDNTLLNDQWITAEIRDKILKSPETNENKNTAYQKHWETAKTALREKFIAIGTHIFKKNQRSEPGASNPTYLED